MRKIETFMMCMLVIIGVITSVSDLKTGKIQNKIIAGFACVAIVIDVIYYGYYARDIFSLFLGNYLILLMVSLFLFYSHSFAGGDCKLVMVMGLMYPANYYLIYDTTSITVFMVLGIAVLYGYIFLLGSSLYELIRGNNVLSKEYVGNYLINFIKAFVTATLYISVVNIFLTLLIQKGGHVFPVFTRIICIVTAWCVGKYDFLKKRYVFASVIVIDIIGGIKMGIVPFSTNLENYIIILVLLICQMMIRSNLYKDVAVSELKKGMILSVGATVLMQGSRVRGLPQLSTEDLKSRLTEKEVASVKRWAASREIENITVVKKIPFAIFIFGGFLSYYFMWSVL